MEADDYLVLEALYFSSWATVFFNDLTQYLWETCSKCQKPWRYQKCTNINQHGLKVYLREDLLHKHYRKNITNALDDFAERLEWCPQIKAHLIIRWQTCFPNYLSWDYLCSRMDLLKTCITSVYNESCGKGTIFDYVKTKSKEFSDCGFNECSLCRVK